MTVTLSNYVSYFCSQYHSDFVALGYPELDVAEYDDGSWAIIEYLRSPVVPCLTPFKPVLTNIKHLEKNLNNFRKYTNQLDLEKQHIWAEMDAKEKALEEQELRKNAHSEDIASRQLKVIKGNPELMERISRNGMGEINLRKLAKHIPNHHYR